MRAPGSARCSPAALEPDWWAGTPLADRSTSGRFAGRRRVSKRGPARRTTSCGWAHPRNDSTYAVSKSARSYPAGMNAEIIVPVTVFSMYAVALLATAAVCYKYRAEIFQ